MGSKHRCLVVISEHSWDFLDYLFSQHATHFDSCHLFCCYTGQYVLILYQADSELSHKSEHVDTEPTVVLAFKIAKPGKQWHTKVILVIFIVCALYES